jgi:hypothetical protein
MYDSLFTANMRKLDPSLYELASRKSVDDLLMESTLEEEYNQKLNLPKIGDKLRKAANTADRISGAMKIIDEACKRNPSGLPW